MNATFCPVTGSKHLLTTDESSINGEVVCTACGTVIQQDLVTNDQLGTFADHQYQSAIGTYHLAKTFHTTTTSNLKEIRDFKQYQTALTQMHGDAMCLGLPEGYFTSVSNLFERVRSESSFKLRFGTQSRLVGVCCIILISRTLGGTSVSILVQQACLQLYLNPVLLGKYLVKIRPFVLPSIILDDHSPHSILRPLSVAVDLNAYVYKILADMHRLSHPTTDALFRAFFNAKSCGDRYKASWFQPIEIPTSTTTEFAVINKYQLVVQTLLQTCRHLFESRHLMPCALAVACIAREATERIPCSAAIWCTLLNLAESPTTCFVRQREMHDFFATAASELPWHDRITVRSYSPNTYPTISFFLWQIMDLIRAKIILPGAGEPPSRTKSRVQNESVYNYVTRAIDRLAMNFGVIVVPDMNLFDENINDIPPSPCKHTRFLDDLDLAFESLLLSGQYKVSQLLSLRLKDVVALSNNLDTSIRSNRTNMDDSDLNSDDDEL